MRVLLSGGTGFIGRALVLDLLKKGHEVTMLVRSEASIPADWPFPTQKVIWDMQRGKAPLELSPENYEALIHLAGASIADGFWTKKRKEELKSSRVDTSRALARFFEKRSNPLPVMISASAIGYYSDLRGKILEETSPKGEGFLAELTEAWESAAGEIPSERTVKLRFGLVLAQGGGFLKPLRLATRLGLGARIGDGRQKMSFIHRTDLCRVVLTALEDSRYQGPINVVAPHAVTQEYFQEKLSKDLQRPAFLRVPEFLPKFFLGEMATLILGSQDVQPKKLQELGFTFQYSTLSEAFQEALDLIEKDGRLYPCHRLEAVQFIPRPQEKVTPFFAAPENLERITPESLSFRIEKKSSEEIRQGTVIHYRIKLHGLPLKWKTRIADWDMPHSFSDNQEEGPYAIWYHTHSFFAVRGGTLMTDKVRYRLPFGALGDLVALPFVRRDVKGIFKYRKVIIAREFPAPSREALAFSE